MGTKTKGFNEWLKAQCPHCETWHDILGNAETINETSCPNCSKNHSNIASEPNTISLGNELHCKYDCGYCFNKPRAKRFFPTNNFADFELNPRKVNKKYLKSTKQPAICFNSHDIFPEILEECKTVIGKLLASGNFVLIVTKAGEWITEDLRRTFSRYKDQMEFRFTITTMNDVLAKKYEPNAPAPVSRFNALMETMLAGFKTSVSLEPFLSDPVPTAASLSGFCTEGIWVGPMNNVSLANDPMLKHLYEPEFLLHVKHHLKDIKNIRYKDAFINRLNKLPRERQLELKTD